MKAKKMKAKKMKAKKMNENAANGNQKVSRFRHVMANICLLACVALIPEIAMANPLTQAVDWVMDLLTNGIARSVAIIGIAILGYLAWAGRITGESCAKFIAGIVLIFGGSTLVDLMIGAVS